VLEICDRGAMPAYLETAKDINVPFYEKHGFKIVDETDLPDGPKVWLMKRPPA
jgi:hypothetical protein